MKGKLVNVTWYHYTKSFDLVIIVSIRHQAWNPYVNVIPDDLLSSLEQERD